MRATISTPGEAQANDVKAQIEQRGFAVRPGVFETGGGRITGELVVSAR